MAFLRFRFPGQGFAATALVAAGLTAGCSYPNRGHPIARVGEAIGWSAEKAAFDPPRQRFGLMPFGAWYAPWTPLDVGALGHHRHNGAGVLGTALGSPRSEEVSRGILYTRRGGFLDIAHLRNAVDLTAFVHAEVAPRLHRGGRVTLRLVSAEPDVYHLQLHPPAHATPNERARAAVEIAGRVGHLMTTWHEVLTWYGYRAMGVVTERPSAFSYDDAASHRVGVELAMRVLREVSPEPGQSRPPGSKEVDAAVFDAAVTDALPKVLRELGVVSPDEATARMRSLEGQWWGDGRPLFRVIDLGIAGEPLVARTLAPSLARASVDPPAAAEWTFDPDLAVAGVPLHAWFDITIEPQTFEASAIREAAGVKDAEGDGRVHPRTHFARLKRSLLEAAAP